MALEPTLIKPRELPAAMEVFATDALVVDNGAEVRKATPVQIVNSGRPVASEAETAAGVRNDVAITPLRLKQAIDGIFSGTSRLTPFSVTATAGQTVFPVPMHPVGNDLLLVFVNGVSLPSGEYTEAATTITLDTPAIAGDVVHGWVLASYAMPVPTQDYVTPEDFGAVEGQDATAALNSAFHTGLQVWPRSDREYPVSGAITIPNGAIISGHLRLITPSDLATRLMTIGDDVTLGDLTVTSRGTGSSAARIVAGKRLRAGHIHLEDVAPGFLSDGFVFGSGCEIDCLSARNVARPFALSNVAAGSVSSGGYIGRVEVETYIRAFTAKAAYGWTVASLTATGRHPAAAKTPGHNGVLVEGCSHWRIEDMHIAGAGEHGFRLGGKPFPAAASRDWHIGRYTFSGIGGCPFKVNPGVAGEYAREGSVATILGFDNNAEFSGEGNSEFLRIAHCKGLAIGYAALILEDGSSATLRSALRCNDVSNITIDNLRADAVTHSLIDFNEDTDADGGREGDIQNVRIGNLDGFTIDTSATIRISMPTRRIGGIYINGGLVRRIGSGGFVRADSIAGGVDLPMFFGCVIGGATPPFNVDAPTDWQFDVTYKSTRQMGRMLAPWSGGLTITGDPFAGGDVADGRSAMALRASLVAAAPGAVGAALDFSRPASGRRAGAIVARQTGAGSQNAGLAIYTAGNVDATDEVFLRAQFDHQGDFEMLGHGAGIFLRDGDGTRYRLAISGGALTVEEV